MSWISNFCIGQIDALRHELEEFFGKDPMTSKDISSIVNEYHFIRLMKLMEEDGVYDKIVLGGQADVNQLQVPVAHIHLSCSFLLTYFRYFS